MEFDALIKNTDVFFLLESNYETAKINFQSRVLRKKSVVEKAEIVFEFFASRSLNIRNPF